MTSDQSKGNSTGMFRPGDTYLSQALQKFCEQIMPLINNLCVSPTHCPVHIDLQYTLKVN